MCFNSCKTCFAQFCHWLSSVGCDLVFCMIKKKSQDLHFTRQITKEQAWESTWNILISFWIKWLSRGKEIFSEKVVRLFSAGCNISFALLCDWLFCSVNFRPPETILNWTKWKAIKKKQLLIIPCHKLCITMLLVLLLRLYVLIQADFSNEQ